MKLVFPLVLLLFAASVSAQSIDIDLRYGTTPGYDDNNDGIGEVVDFDVSHSSTSFAASDEFMCTRWRTVPSDALATSMCYGSSSCCSLFGLQSSTAQWDAPFYTASSGEVEAQVLYAQYSFDANADTLIAYSDPARLSATTLPLNAQSVQIIAPANGSLVNSNVTIQIAATDNVTFSLNNLSNETLMPQGGIAQAVLTLPTGPYNLTVWLENETLQTTFVVGEFVNDTTPPAISLFNVSNTTFIVQLSEPAVFEYILDGTTSSLALNATYGALFTLPLTDGLHNLTLRATDNNSNVNEVQHSLSTVVESCGDGVRNFHNGLLEDGVDCGGSCNACVVLDVSTDKSSYQSGELVFIQVTARSDATHTLSVTGPETFTSSGNGSTYYIITPTLAGTYTIAASLSYKNGPLETDTTSVSVSSVAHNPLTVTIDSNASDISVNDKVSFTASVSGNSTPVAYAWDFQNDSTVDATTQMVNYTFAQPGSYNVSLYVKDSSYNRTVAEQLTVLPLYNVTFFVVDQYASSPLAAVVDVGSIRLTPPYAAPLRKGTHSLKVNVSGYQNYSSTVYVDSNESFTISLAAASAPSVALVSPAANATLTEGQQTFSATVSYFPASCSLEVGSSSVLQVVSTTSVNSSSVSFVHTPRNDSTHWRVSCTTPAGSSYSELRSFSISLLSQGDQKTVEGVDELIEQIDAALVASDSWVGTTKEAASVMGYRKLLDDAKFELQRANRDLFNVKWRKFSAEEEEQFKVDLLNRVATVRGNLTLNMTVLRSSEFVSYPENSVVESAAKAAVDLSLFSEKEVAQYVSDNIDLQNELQVTTKYYILEAYDADGQLSKKTLIKRKLTSYNHTGVMLLEVIPKSVARSASDITFLVDVEVVEDDPIVKVLSEGDEYSFIVQRELTPVEIQSTAAVIINPEANKVIASKDSVTGFSVVGMETIVSPLGLIIELVVVGVLLGGYVTYQSMYSGSSQLKEMRKIVRATLEHTESEVEKSREHYKALAAQFSSLVKEERSLIYDDLVRLNHKINRDNLSVKLNDATVLLSHGQKQNAVSLYNEVQKLYKSLSKEYKEEIFERCREFHGKLQGKT